VFIKVLYVVLVLCMVALLGAVGAAYLKIRKQMRDSGKASKGAVEDKNQTGMPSGS